ncbi:DUF3631 domain-containing protein [Thermopirellula anaerolimosa]
MNWSDTGLEISVAPAARGSTRLVEVYHGPHTIRERVDTDSMSAVRKFAKYTADYLNLIQDDADFDEFFRWFYGTVTQAAEVADEKASQEAAHHLAKTATERPNNALPGQGRPVELRDLEPWLDPVDLGKTLQQCARYIQKYVYCQAEQADAAALYLAWTYCFRHFEVAPILVITSPTKRCGKTTLLRLILHVANRPIPAVNISPAGVYRVVDAFLPTLLIDEADTFLGRNPELTGIVNSGWMRDNAYTLRCDLETGEPRMFCTFCPKVIAAIGRLSDTVEDRSIIITMERRPKNVPLARVRKAAKTEGETLARQFLAWVMEHQPEIQEAAEGEPPLPEELDDRAYENWRPLVILAELAGGDWPARARQAALWVSMGKVEAPPQDLGTRLLADVREVFGEADALTSSELIQRLTNLEEAPWSTFSHGRPISPHKVASILGRFGVKPVKRKNANHYLRDDLERVFTLYLPPQSSTSSTGVVSADLANKLGSGTSSKPLSSAASKFHPISDCLKTTYDNGGTCGTLKTDPEEEFEEFEL